MDHQHPNTLLRFALVNSLSIEIVTRVHWDKPEYEAEETFLNNLYSADIRGAAVYLGEGHTQSIFTSGSTPIDAMRKLVANIRGKTLTVEPQAHLSRRHVQVPEDLHVGECGAL